MSEENRPGAVDGSFDFFCRIGIVRFDNTSSEKVVHLLIHARVHHDISVVVDDLKYRSGLYAWFVRRTLHGKVFGPSTFRKFQNVDAKRCLAGDHACRLPYLIDACRPDLLFLRADKEKRQHGQMKSFLHRTDLSDREEMLTRTGTIKKRF